LHEDAREGERRLLIFRCRFHYAIATPPLRLCSAAILPRAAIRCRHYAFADFSLMLSFAIADFIFAIFAAMILY